MKPNILKNMLSSSMTNHVTSSEILNFSDVITKQNYFTHGDKTITQTDGLAMGASSSGIISEIFLQHYLTFLPPYPGPKTQNSELLLLIKWVAAKFVLHMPHRKKKQACECGVICRKGSKMTQ